VADTYVEDAGVGRRELLKKTAIGGGLVVAALAAPGLTGTAEAKGGKSFNLDVDVDESSFVSPTDVPGGTGPFYVGGTIFRHGHPAPSIGTFHCWGFITTTGVGVVDQEFDIDGRGKILISGVESDAPRGVTGGTGDFANARGEGTNIEFLDVGSNEPEGGDPFDFTIDFNLTGARGPSIV
jgi:hypothetical protein